MIVPIDERWEALPPLDVTEEDKQYAILHYGEEHETQQIYELGTKLASELHCRERQLREALSTLSATQRELEEAKVRLAKAENKISSRELWLNEHSEEIDRLSDEVNRMERTQTIISTVTGENR